MTVATGICRVLCNGNTAEVASDTISSVMEAALIATQRKHIQSYRNGVQTPWSKPWAESLYHMHFGANRAWCAAALLDDSTSNLYLGNVGENCVVMGKWDEGNQRYSAQPIDFGVSRKVRWTISGRACV